jgi:hypothetical protein
VSGPTQLPKLPRDERVDVLLLPGTLERIDRELVRRADVGHHLSRGDIIREALMPHLERLERRRLREENSEVAV